MQLIAVAYKKNNESNVSDGMSQMITDITHSNCMNMFDIVKNLKTLTHPWKSNKSGLRAKVRTMQFVSETRVKTGDG